MPRKIDKNTQRQIWVPSRPNKTSSEEIIELDDELSGRANRFGGGYQPLEDRRETNNQQQPEIIGIEPESEVESQIFRGDKFPSLI